MILHTELQLSSFETRETYKTTTQKVDTSSWDQPAEDIHVCPLGVSHKKINFIFLNVPKI